MAIIFPVTVFIIFGIIQFGCGITPRPSPAPPPRKAPGRPAPTRPTRPRARPAPSKSSPTTPAGSSPTTSVVPYRDTEVATVTVSGQALQVIPFIPLAMHASATAPVEAYRPPPRS